MGDLWWIIAILIAGWTFVGGFVLHTRMDDKDPWWLVPVCAPYAILVFIAFLLLIFWDWIREQF
jgi:hypothetical protein